MGSREEGRGQGGCSGVAYSGLWIPADWHASSPPASDTTVGVCVCVFTNS